MKLNTLVLGAALTLGVGSFAAPWVVAAEHEGHGQAQAQIAVNAPNLHKALRALWQGHVETTHNYALAVFAQDKNAANKAADSVVANAKEISTAVAGFYGQPAGDGLLKLLAGHWGAIKALTDAAQQANAAAEDKALNEAIANAGEIAKFLAGANPNWKESDLNSALVAHGGHHKSQVDLMAKKAPQAEQEEQFVAMQKHMQVIADVLADGIAKQFPDKVN